MIQSVKSEIHPPNQPPNKKGGFGLGRWEGENRFSKEQRSQTMGPIQGVLRNSPLEGNIR